MLCLCKKNCNIKIEKSWTTKGVGQNCYMRAILHQEAGVSKGGVRRLLRVEGARNKPSTFTPIGTTCSCERCDGFGWRSHGVKFHPKSVYLSKEQVDASLCGNWHGIAGCHVRCKRPRTSGIQLADINRLQFICRKSIGLCDELCLRHYVRYGNHCASGNIFTGLIIVVAVNDGLPCGSRGRIAEGDIIRKQQAVLTDSEKERKKNEGQQVQTRPTVNRFAGHPISANAFDFPHP